MLCVMAMAAAFSLSSAAVAADPYDREVQQLIQSVQSSIAEAEKIETSMLARLNGSNIKMFRQLFTTYTQIDQKQLQFHADLMNLSRDYQRALGSQANTDPRYLAIQDQIQELNAVLQTRKINFTRYIAKLTALKNELNQRVRFARSKAESRNFEIMVEEISEALEMVVDYRQNRG